MSGFDVPDAELDWLLNSERASAGPRVEAMLPRLVAEIRRWRNEDAREAKYEWVSRQTTYAVCTLREVLAHHEGGTTGMPEAMAWDAVRAAIRKLTK